MNMLMRLAQTMRVRYRLALPIVALVVTTLAIAIVYLFAPPLPDLPLPRKDLRLAAWLGVTWSMDAHDTDDLRQLAQDLQERRVDDAFVYVSYLKADNTFNATFDYAADFVKRMKNHAPETRLLAWIGVPVSVELDDGTAIKNRLATADVRQLIADFSRFAVEDLGFAGIHLNAELIVDDDPYLPEILQGIRGSLPPDAWLSATAHALRLDGRVTAMPYPIVEHHWTREYLQRVAESVDQIALMAYDSGLPFPRDYLSWVSYQTVASQQALLDFETELIIGLPASEEWTPSHQTQAETLRIALAGLKTGIESRLTGIAVYPYWETDATEWQLISRSLGR